MWWNFKEDTVVFSPTKWFWNIVCEIISILHEPQCVKYRWYNKSSQLLVLEHANGSCFRNYIFVLLFRNWETLIVLESNHDDVIKWRHFPRYWSFVREIHRSPVNSPHKGQWREALNFLWSVTEQTIEQTMDMVWYYDMIWCDVMRHDKIYDIMWYDTIYDIIWYDVIWFTAKPAIG